MTQFLQFSMRRSLPLFLLFAALPSHAQNASAVYEKVVNSVGIVLVSTFEGDLVASGSAVTVASQTMVTNRHVLLPGHRYTVLVPGASHEAFMTNCDGVQDLCLLNVPKLEAKPVEFAEATKLHVGDSVFAIGAPHELSIMRGVAAVTNQKNMSSAQLTMSNGMITALRPVEDGNVIQTNAAISPGSSGGGLFDINGRLTGITTFGMKGGQNLNMALPVNWVERLGVKGSPRTNDGTTADMPSISAPTLQSPQATSGNTARPESNLENNTPAPEAPKGLWGSNIEFKPWWAVIPGLLLIWFFMRRRSNADEFAADAIFIPPPPTSAAAPINSDHQLQTLIEQAAQEFDSKQIDERIFKQALLESKGNKDAARTAYIQKRANRLLSIEKDKAWAHAAQQTKAH